MSASKRDCSVVAELASAFTELVMALSFYADPDSYFAIGIFADRPAGEFADDFSEHGDPNYEEGDQRPGKRARAALDRWHKAHQAALNGSCSSGGDQ